MWLGAGGLGLGIRAWRRIRGVFVFGDAIFSDPTGENRAKEARKAWASVQKYGFEIFVSGIGLGLTVADGEGNRVGPVWDIVEGER